MAKQVINIGTAANDGSGDPLRTAFTKANENFTEVYNTSQSSFNLANTVNVSVQSSFTQANTANTKAQLAFDTGNTVNLSVQSSFTQANTANVNAQAAFDKANTTSNATITIVSLKSLVANSASYADFQTAIASL